MQKAVKKSGVTGGAALFTLGVLAGVSCAAIHNSSWQSAVQSNLPGACIGEWPARAG
jgi:hypothetical protein